MKKFLPFLVILSLVTLPWVAHARFMSEAERACGREAAERYQQVLSDAHSTYYRALEALIEERNRAYIVSWDSEEDRDQRQRERDAKRIFRDGIRAIRREKSSRVSDAGRQYRDERRNCRDLARANNATASSRSSSSLTSSARTSSFPSSSSFPSGQDCSDMICADGTRYPRCENGHPINYFADPCTFSGNVCTYDTECPNDQYCKREQNCRFDCSASSCTYLCGGRCRIKS